MKLALDSVLMPENISLPEAEPEETDEREGPEGDPEELQVRIYNCLLADKKLNEVKNYCCYLGVDVC